MIERGKREPRPSLPASLSLVGERPYGDTVVLIVARAAAQS